MENSWDKVQKATTPNELRRAIVEELHLRAWQERAGATIGRTTKEYRTSHEHAAKALECLAKHLTELTESAEVKA
jgi:hypothetical protein